MKQAGGQQTNSFLLAGGLDLITPAISLRPGAARGALNYECALNGYQRFAGFERFDGRLAPSAATSWQITFAFGNAAITTGQTVTGQTSGATGVALSDGVVSAGSYGGSNAVGILGLGAVSGTFINGENLRVGGVTKAVSTSTADLGASPDDATLVAWNAQAATNARALIAAVPGSGVIRGIWYFPNTNAFYAFRDNVGATACVMHKSTTAGWVPVTMSKTVAFTSGGTYEIQEGDVVTGATSGKTATISRVVRTSGDWSAGTAAGYLVYATSSGAFVAENLDVPGHANSATIVGDGATVVLPAGGRYSFVNHNFYGSTNLRRMYGVNGVGLAFEFDGTTFVPISAIPASPALDKPSSIAVHRQALALGYDAGAVELSVVGNPLSFLGTAGAVDIGVGDQVIELVSQRGSLAIFCKNSIQILYGNDSTDYNLQVFTDEAGALPYSVQELNSPIFMDSRGIRALRASQVYGNFDLGTLSQAVRPLIQSKIDAGVTPVASTRRRDSDLYRLFFSDNTVLSIFLGKKSPECMMLDLGMALSCACSVTDTANVERVLFGSSDGFIYEMDRGTSFDGAEFFRYVRLPFNSLGSPQLMKRYHKAVLECSAAPGTVLNISADFDYGDPDTLASDLADVPLEGGGGQWDLSNWDQFYWSAPFEGTGEVYLDGVGKNMSLLIAGTSADEPSHLLQGMTLFFTVRGLRR